MNIALKFRLICFCFHLLVSLFIALLAMGLVFWLWYPSPLDKALGITNVFLLLICIDVIVGPLLTLIVANKNKKSLKIDLLAIGIIQVLALSYGLYIVAQGRPVWVIYDAGRFELVQAYEAVLKPDDSVSSHAFKPTLAGPIWGAVKAQMPPTISRGDAYYQAEFLQGYDQKIAVSVAAHSVNLAVLKRFNEPKKVDAILKAYPEADRFIPMAAKQQSLVVLINKNVGQPIAIVNLSPW